MPANDKAGTLLGTQRLCNVLNRENMMVKVPATLVSSFFTRANERVYITASAVKPSWVESGSYSCSMKPEHSVVAKMFSRFNALRSGFVADHCSGQAITSTRLSLVLRPTVSCHFCPS